MLGLTSDIPLLDFSVAFTYSLLCQTTKPTFTTYIDITFSKGKRGHERETFMSLHNVFKAVELGGKIFL